MIAVMRNESFEFGGTVDPCDGAERSAAPCLPRENLGNFHACIDD